MSLEASSMGEVIRLLADANPFLTKKIEARDLWEFQGDSEPNGGDLGSEFKRFFRLWDILQCDVARRFAGLDSGFRATFMIPREFEKGSHSRRERRIFPFSCLYGYFSLLACSKMVQYQPKRGSTILRNSPT